MDLFGLDGSGSREEQTLPGSRDQQWTFGPSAARFDEVEQNV